MPDENMQVCYTLEHQAPEEEQKLFSTHNRHAL